MQHFRIRSLQRQTLTLWLLNVNDYDKCLQMRSPAKPETIAQVTRQGYSLECEGLLFFLCEDLQT